MPLKKFSLLLFLLLAAGLARAEQALLWQVERDGRVNHLFGTIHLSDPRVTRLPPPVEEAFSAADRVVLEARLDVVASMTMVRRMMLPDGEQLRNYLPEPLYRDTLAVTTGLGYPEESVNRMRPWAVVLTLSFPADSGPVLDQLLSHRARKAGKPVLGLETPEEQIAIFDELSESEQILLLRQAVEEAQEMAQTIELMTGAYLERDLQALQRQHETSLAALPETLAEKFNRGLMTDRDSRMAERLGPILEEGGVFAAVGALHLPGVVRRLREQGYSVSAVY